MEPLFVVGDEPMVNGVGISSSGFGKAAEYLAVAKLLSLGHRVAIPVVDDDGVDLVVNYRTTVQVKSSGRRVMETMPGYSYRAFTWTKLGKKGTARADVYLLHGEDDGSHRWWCVPADVMRSCGGTLCLYEGSNRGLSGELHRYADAWGVFDGD